MRQPRTPANRRPQADQRPKAGSRVTRAEPPPQPGVKPPPVPAKEWAPEVEAGWLRLTEGLQSQALSKDEIAERRALLTSMPPRKRKQLSRDERIKLLYGIRKNQSPKFNKLTPANRRAVLMVDALEDEGVPVTKMAHKRLLALVSTPEAPVGTRALAYAKAYRREHPR
jgi:hypothetical protein